MCVVVWNGKVVGCWRESGRAEQSRKDEFAHLIEDLVWWW